MPKLTLLTFDEIRSLLVETDPTDESIISLLAFSVTLEIENYCGRVFVSRPITEYQGGSASDAVTTREYPVTAFKSLEVKDRTRGVFQLLNSDYYTLTPEPGESSGPIDIELVSGYTFPRGKNNIKLKYTAGYLPGEVPDDLKMAFCEIISWMLKRLKARQVGVHTLDRAANQKGPLLYDPNIPEHARQILQSYRRKGF